MDEEVAEYLLGLRQINKALITGLETAILVMSKWNDFEPERRQAIIDNLNSLIEESNKAYGIESTKH